MNGILNEKDRAGQLAYQNAPLVNEGEKAVKPDEIHLMHIPPADTTLGEVLVAGYEKLLAPTLGYSNADQAYADTLQGRGEESTLSLGHSRGTIVQTNALNIAAESGYYSKNREQFAAPIEHWVLQIPDTPYWFAMRLIGSTGGDGTSWGINRNPAKYEEVKTIFHQMVESVRLTPLQ